MATVINFFFPGLGHVIIGRWVAGIIWFFAVLIGYVLCIVPGIVLHIWCMIEAWKLEQADKLQVQQRTMWQALYWSKQMEQK